MGKYITEKDVTVRLLGKVQFTDDQNDQNKFPNTLLREYIAHAEAQVEYDLSPRYAGPFVLDDGTQFPQFTARGAYVAYNMIRNLCQLQGVIRILESDFGRGSVVNSEKFSQKLEERYVSMITEKFLAKKKMGDGSESQQWQYPPIPMLKLNYMNTEADDGYMGQVLVTGQVTPQYPQFQTNDPSENFWNGVFDDPNLSPGAIGSNGGSIPGGGNGV